MEKGGGVFPHLPSLSPALTQPTLFLTALAPLMCFGH